MQHQLLLAIRIDDIDYLSTLYFSKKDDGQYYMNYYISTELYNNVKFTLLLVKGKCNTTPYFEKMRRCILDTMPVPSNHVEDINGRNQHSYTDCEDNPFFETIIRKKMSEKMARKIKQKYDYSVSQQIFKYCGKTKTLRFTSDIAKSKDIVTYLNSNIR